MHLLLIVGVGSLQFPQQVLFVLGGALGALQSDPPAAFGIARSGAIVVFGQTVVLCFCLVHGAFSVGCPLLGIQALVLPVLAARLDISRQLV